MIVFSSSSLHSIKPFEKKVKETLYNLDTVTFMSVASQAIYDNEWVGFASEQLVKQLSGVHYCGSK